MTLPADRSTLSRWRTVAVAVVVAATAVAAPVSSATAAADASDQGTVTQQIQRLVESYRAATGVAGVSLAVVRPNALGTHADTVYVTSGYASVETKQPVTRLTQFEIASETKAFTGGLLAYLVTTGRVSLDDPLQKYAPPGVTVPVWSENGVDTPIRLRDLATHQSGLPDTAANESDGCPPSNPGCYDNEKYYTEAMMWDAIKHVELRWKPGTNWMYSNFATGVLGTVLSNVLYPGHNPPAYQQALKTAYLDDLRMRSTLLEQPTRRLATGYDLQGSPAPYLDDTNAVAGEAGIISDATDMGTWIRASLGWEADNRGAGVRSLPAATQPISTITTSCKRLDVKSCRPDDFRMGMGWQLYDAHQSGFGVPIAYKDGGSAGFASLTILAPDQKTGVTILTNQQFNQQDDLIDPLGTQILQLLLKAT